MLDKPLFRPSGRNPQSMMRCRPIASTSFAVLMVVQMSLSVESVLAGPNAGGTLVVHANTAIIYSGDTYCGDANLSSCAAATTTVNGNGTFVFFVLAAFPSPGGRLSGATFGIAYDPTHINLVDSGSCADFELSTNGWPGPCSAIALTWSLPQVSPIVPLYWFAGYSYSVTAPTLFCAAPHLDDGGYFGDDSVPSQLDPIAGYGALGFNTPGIAACPSSGSIASGGCCLADCCQPLTEVACAGLGGRYIGDDVACDPDGCSTPTIEASWGRVKSHFRD